MDNGKVKTKDNEDDEEAKVKDSVDTDQNPKKTSKNVRWIRNNGKDNQISES